MFMNKTLKLFSLLALYTYSCLSFAGGPLILEGSGGSTPVTYQNPNITLHIESGDLGALSNTDADTLVQEAFNLWNNVNTSTINLVINQTAITTDIDINNFNDFLPAVDGSDLNADDNLNPVVYDSNGEIIDEFFGVGQSNSTIGFAASIFNLNGNFFNEGYAVINGKDLGLTDTKFKLLITHEIGHFFGIDHSQTNINNQEKEAGIPAICSSSTQDKYPVMYPFVCRDEESLHTDDISAISALYPATNINNFGILQGRFLNESGNPVLGANIWAENTTTGETISIVSDYLRQGTGFYKLYLPAGNYTLHVNSINTLFNGGSSVGPYAESILDISFTSPHPLTEVTYQGTTEGNDEIITISNDQTITINFSSTGADIAVNNSDDDDSFADLFGATSHATILLLLMFIICGRNISYRNQHNSD